MPVHGEVVNHTADARVAPLSAEGLRDEPLRFVLNAALVAGALGAVLVVDAVAHRFSAAWRALEGPPAPGPGSPRGPVRAPTTARNAGGGGVPADRPRGTLRLVEVGS